MKIKQTRQVRLDELIKHCIENDKFGNEGTFWSTTGKVKVMVYKDDVVIEDDFMVMACNIIETLFVITEEVEVTEDTILDRFVHVLDSGRTKDVKNISISKLIRLVKNFDSTVKFVYLQNEDGSIGDLIWKDGKFIV